jgi:hypothetical protein
MDVEAGADRSRQVIRQIDCQEEVTFALSVQSSPSMWDLHGVRAEVVFPLSHPVSIESSIKPH